jgi:hypothetical protein
VMSVSSSEAQPARPTKAKATSSRRLFFMGEQAKRPWVS